MALNEVKGSSQGRLAGLREPGGSGIVSGS